MSYENEEWQDIPLTNGDYQISSFGRVRSWVRRGTYRKTRSIPLVLKTALNGNGYPHVCIMFSEIGEVKNARIHRMVGEAFVPNPNNLPHVLHKDDDKLNVHYSNFEWGNHEKNMRDAFIRKRIIPAKGVARRKSSLTEKDVSDIFISKDTCYSLAEKYKVNHTCISDIRSGRSWNHITGLPCTRKIKPKYSKDVIFI